MMAAETDGRGRDRSGFTLVEVLVASSLAALVLTAVLTTFIWCGKQAAHCAKIAWSQRQAMNTADKLTMYLRNASGVVAIDEEEGMWVQLRFPDESSAHLVYSNAVPEVRDGRLYLVRTNGTETIVARGLTEIQNPDGFTTPIFSQTRDNALRLAYRVSEPAAGGGRAADDGAYAACVRFAACLRNGEG
jgi:prepilin-type N-terminal cleavage/methylation domain-containing protein